MSASLLAVIIYLKNCTIIGSAIGLLWSVLVDLLYKNSLSFSDLLWNCAMFSLAIVLVDWFKKSKVFSENKVVE